VGSLGSANASLIIAETQRNRLFDGPSDIERQRAQIAIQQAELGVEMAQTNLDRTRLTSPFSGVVADTNMTVGELPPAAGVVELIDASTFYVDLAIDETEIVDIEIGQTVELTLDALPESDVTGHIVRVAQTPTHIGQVVTYTARVALDPTSEPIRVGMNTTATIKVKELNDVLTLRNRFIRIDRATQQAYVTIQREDGRFEEVEVELGLRNETESQIVSGLQAGQRVVLLPREELDLFGGDVPRN
jgi:HlyD family secretion protein